MASKIKIKINDKEITTEKGKTILEVCKENNIYIPTFCYHKELGPIGSCGICIVEVQGHGIVRACNTFVSDEMSIQTANDNIISIRKKHLEFLITEHCGDCYPPCQLACPAGIDIQGYIKLIAKGAYKEAVELIKEKIALPAVIGRICASLCENAYRRNLVDIGVAIRDLKRFVADLDLWSDNSIIPKIEPTGFKIAIIGSGPSGLSAAYF